MFPLTDEDKKARTLCGLPIPIENVQIYPLTVKDVVLVGEQYYQYQLGLLTMLKKIVEIRSNLTDDDLEEIDDFALIFYITSTYPMFKDEIKSAMEFFLKGAYIVEINNVDYSICIYDSSDSTQLVGKLKEQEYNEFIAIIRHQNYLDKKDDDERPADDAARELMEQRRRAREMVAKAKGQKGENLSLADYLSIASGKSLKNNHHFLETTIYSFYNYLERLMVIENYEVSLQQILAGADSKRIKLEHWAKKL